MATRAGGASDPGQLVLNASPNSDHWTALLARSWDVTAATKLGTLKPISSSRSDRFPCGRNCCGMPLTSTGVRLSAVCAASASAAPSPPATPLSSRLSTSSTPRVSATRSGETGKLSVADDQHLRIAGGLQDVDRTSRALRRNWCWQALFRIADHGGCVGDVDRALQRLDQPGLIARRAELQ